MVNRMVKNLGVVKVTRTPKQVSDEILMLFFLNQIKEGSERENKTDRKRGHLKILLVRCLSLVSIENEEKIRIVYFVYFFNYLLKNHRFYFTKVTPKNLKISNIL